jgi:hypothetical protein
LGYHLGSEGSSFFVREGFVGPDFDAAVVAVLGLFPSELGTAASTDGRGEDLGESAREGNLGGFEAAFEHPTAHAIPCFCGGVVGVIFGTDVEAFHVRCRETRGGLNDGEEDFVEHSVVTIGVAVHGDLFDFEDGVHGFFKEIYGIIDLVSGKSVVGKFANNSRHNLLLLGCGLLLLSTCEATLRPNL